MRMQRIEIQHQMLKGTIGSNFFGPVEEVLRFTEGRQRMVLDLGTGKGHWYAYTPLSWILFV